MSQKKTIILKAEQLNQKEVSKLISQTISNDQTVVFPTETVYGIGGNALSSKAVKAIYEAKGRPSDNPLIIHIARKKDVYLYAKNISDQAKQLMKVFWPGPLTMIFNKKDIVPYETTGGLDTVAIRYPNHELAKKMIKSSGLPVAAPSANRSGRPSSTKFKHVYEDLFGYVDIMIDGGDSLIGIESTVIDLTTKNPVILRPGFITKEMIEQTLNQPIEDESNHLIGEKVKSPGMKYTHYKPKGHVILLKGSIENIKLFLLDKSKNNHDIACICVNEHQEYFNFMRTKTIGSLSNMNEIAKNLFSVLREMDEWNIETIYVEMLPSEHLGYAIMNRLLKASGYTIIEL